MKLVVVALLAIISLLALSAKEYIFFSTDKIEEKGAVFLKILLLFVGYIALFLSNCLLLWIAIKQYQENKKRTLENKFYNLLIEEISLLDDLSKKKESRDDDSKLGENIKDLYIIRQEKLNLFLKK